jgi:hypothetical protein
MKLTIRPLTPDLWPALEGLFGKNGACNGCWCQLTPRDALPWLDRVAAQARGRCAGLVALLFLCAQAYRKQGVTSALIAAALQPRPLPTLIPEEAKK